MKRAPSIEPCGCPDYIEVGSTRFNASEYGFPFFLYNEVVYIAPIHSGHKKYAPVLAEQLGIDVSELTDNVRHRHTTGRIYPRRSPLRHSSRLLRLSLRTILSHGMIFSS